MKVSRRMEFPKIFTDFKNRLLVFEKEEEGYLYFRVYQYWDRSEFHDSFKITLDELKRRFTIACEPWESFQGISQQDLIAYSYLKDKIAIYL